MLYKKNTPAGRFLLIRHLDFQNLTSDFDLASPLQSCTLSGRTRSVLPSPRGRWTRSGTADTTSGCLRELWCILDEQVPGLWPCAVYFSISLGRSWVFKKKKSKNEWSVSAGTASTEALSLLCYVCSPLWSIKATLHLGSRKRKQRKTVLGNFRAEKKIRATWKHVCLQLELFLSSPEFSH